MYTSIMWKHLKLASPRHPPTMENLPYEILSDIFIRLLAKQLAQMRSVCKSWNALLSKPSFVKSHLQHSTRNNDAILLFFHHQCYFQYSSITTRLTRSPKLELTNFINVPDNPPLNVIGSVDGLICFCCGSNPDICIWNPSLSVVLTLPPSSLPSNFSKNHLQFWFDPKTDDYKVVKLTSFFMPKVEVYSMRKNFWKAICQTFSPHVIRPSHDQNSFSVHGYDGHIHWLCDTYLKSKRQTIMSFDFGAETFSEIPLPDTILDSNVNYTNVLGVLKGKFCVISCVEDGECEVWVMDEYGLAESWVKHHVYHQLKGNIIPYGFTSRGELLFNAGKYSNDFRLYDPVEAKVKTFEIMSRMGISKIVEYVDSLVWIAPFMLSKHDTSCCTISPILQF